MRYFLFFLLIAFSKIVYSQSDSAIFDNQIKLKDGIYTSFDQIIENNPKHEGIQIKYGGFFRKPKIYYVNKHGLRYEKKDTIFLVVHNAKRYVWFKYGFYRLILTGAISTFYIETRNVYSTGQEDKTAQLYYLDIITGKMDKLNHFNIDKIIERDLHIYSSFFEDLMKEQKLYSYVLKFNEHNPIYIKHL